MLFLPMSELPCTLLCPHPASMLSMSNLPSLCLNKPFISTPREFLFDALDPEPLQILISGSPLYLLRNTRFVRSATFQEAH